MPAPPDRVLDPRYAIEPFADSGVSEQQLIELWTATGALSEEAARERVAEVALVAVVRESGEPAGVCTTLLGHFEQLRMKLWNYRTFVAREHRDADIARHLLYETIDYLSDRFTSGEDRRGQGMLMVIQSPLLKQHQNRAVWPTTGFTFIGANARDDHIRVLYFPGAVAPGSERPGSYA